MRMPFSPAQVQVPRLQLKPLSPGRDRLHPSRSLGIQLQLTSVQAYDYFVAPCTIHSPSGLNVVDTLTQAGKRPPRGPQPPNKRSLRVQHNLPPNKSTRVTDPETPAFLRMSAAYSPM